MQMSPSASADPEHHPALSLLQKNSTAPKGLQLQGPASSLPQKTLYFSLCIRLHLDDLTHTPAHDLLRNPAPIPFLIIQESGKQKGQELAATKPAGLIRVFCIGVQC